MIISISIETEIYNWFKNPRVMLWRTLDCNSKIPSSVENGCQVMLVLCPRNTHIQILSQVILLVLIN